MKYTKKDIHVGFTFGPQSAKFKVTAVYEDRVDFIIKDVTYGQTYSKYLLTDLFNLLGMKGWEYHVKPKKYHYEIY